MVNVGHTDQLAHAGVEARIGLSRAEPLQITMHRSG